MNKENKKPQKSRVDNQKPETSKATAPISSVRRVTSTKPLPKSATEQMEYWLYTNRYCAYPDKESKRLLRERTSLTNRQMNTWFNNARRRYLPQILRDEGVEHTRFTLRKFKKDGPTTKRMVRPPPKDYSGNKEQQKIVTIDLTEELSDENTPKVDHFAETEMVVDHMEPVILQEDVSMGMVHSIPENSVAAEPPLAPIDLCDDVCYETDEVRELMAWTPFDDLLGRCEEEDLQMEHEENAAEPNYDVIDEVLGLGKAVFDTIPSILDFIDL